LSVYIANIALPHICFAEIREAMNNPLEAFFHKDAFGGRDSSSQPNSSPISTPANAAGTVVPRVQVLVVVNELLCFVQNNLNNSTKNKLHDCVARFYLPDEVTLAKNALLKTTAVLELCTKLNITSRKGENRKTREVEDIITIILAIDESGQSLPLYVAAKLSRIPTMQPEELSIPSILARLTFLEKQVQDVNTLSTSNTASIARNSDDIKNLKEATPEPTAVAGGSKSQRNPLRQRLVSMAGSDASVSGSKRPRIVSTEEKAGWNEVVARPRKKPVIGSSTVEGFKGGESLFDIFVSHCVKGTDPKGIKKHLEDNSVKVHEIVKVSQEVARFDSFKVTVNRSDKELVCGANSSGLWPSNVMCRPFFKPRNTTTGAVFTTERK
jgi:hypothetical protein